MTQAQTPRLLPALALAPSTTSLMCNHALAVVL
jgi:hypothetical protein